MDICEVGTRSISNCRYFILFKDEWSNYRFIYFIKIKGAFDCIRKTITQITADTRSNIRYFMSDCGSEFTSKRTLELLVQNKIVHKMAAPFHPAQNGIIERDNRTLMEGVRSMLVHMNVPLNLWGEAASTFIYLLNRCINSTTRNKTPYELYFQKKPKLSHLKVFGCLAFVKTQTKDRSGYQPKLEMRSQRGIFVGYHTQDFTYRIYNPVEGKIIITHDVVFDEFSKYDANSEYDYSAIDDVLFQLEQDENDFIEAEDAAEEEGVGQETHNTEVIEQCLAGEVRRNAIGDIEPFTYRDAMNCDNKEEWLAAMQEELTL